MTADRRTIEGTTMENGTLMQGRNASVRPRWPWVLLLVVMGLIGLSTLYVLAVPVDADDFQATTGVDWEAFSAANEEVADYLRREARLLAVGYLGFALIAVTATWSLLRTGHREAGRILWTVPGVLAVAAVVFATGDGMALASFYGVAAVVASGALLGARAGARRRGD